MNSFYGSGLVPSQRRVAGSGKFDPSNCSGRVSRLPILRKRKLIGINRGCAETAPLHLDKMKHYLLKQVKWLFNENEDIYSFEREAD